MPHLFRLQKLAKHSGLSEDAANAEYLRIDFPGGKVRPEHHTRCLDQVESKAVCTFLYILERTLSIANKRAVNATAVLSTSVSSAGLKEHDRIDLLQPDFFGPYDFMSFFQNLPDNDERLSLVPEILKRAYRNPGIYIVLAKALQDCHQYKIAVDVLDSGIKDLKENPFFIRMLKKCSICGEEHEHFDPFEESNQVVDYELAKNAAGLRQWLYLIKGHVLVYWCGHENFVSLFKLLQAIESYQEFPTQEMTYKHRSYYAFALARIGVEEKNEIYMTKAYQLYKECIRETPQYYEGRQWLVGLSYELKKYDECKNHLETIRSYVSKEGYEIYLEKYGDVFEKQEDKKSGAG